MDNSFSDKEVGQIFKALAENQSGGLSQLTIVRNDFGIVTATNLADYFMQSKVNMDLKKLYIKNPIVVNNKLDYSPIFNSMESKLNYFHQLNTLCISQIQLNSECFQPLILVIKNLPALNFLDVSATGMNGNHIYFLLS